VSRLRELVRFEWHYQFRRTTVRVYLAAFVGLCVWAMVGTVQSAREGGWHANSSASLTSLLVVANVVGLLLAAAMAGDAAARDGQLRFAPLLATTPVRPGEYLLGRFLGVLLPYVLLLLVVPIAYASILHLGGVERELVGPFRLTAHAVAYLAFAVPNAAVTVALLVAAATLARSTMAAYVAAALLAALPSGLALVAASLADYPPAGALLDPFGVVATMDHIQRWTTAQRNARLVSLEGALLANRVLWLGVAAGTLALVRARLRVAHLAEDPRRRPTPTATATGDRPSLVPLPHPSRSFGIAMQFRQLAAVATRAFRDVALSRGTILLVLIAVGLVLAGPELLEDLGTPIVPTTARILMLFGESELRLGLIAPALSFFYAGELLWQERDARLDDITAASPVRDWVSLVGKFLGLASVLLLFQLLLVAAGVTVQLLLGYGEHELGLYARAFLGVQLATNLLWAALAFAVHVLVNRKYVGHLLVLAAFAATAAAASFGIEHRLLIYASDPGWRYSDLRGFGAGLSPVLWFKLYWGGWALLLAVAARLLAVRGREHAWGARVRNARRHLSRPVLVTAVLGTAIVVGVGGFLFWNTNVLNAYYTSDERVQRRVLYEQRYGRFRDAAQPRLVASNLRVLLRPELHTATIIGSYQLVNHASVPIDTLHLATASEVVTDSVRLDREARLILEDRDLGHRAYALARPLAPGDTLRLDFTVHWAPRGFGNGGAPVSVTANGSFFTSADWLPAIGYQRGRELSSATQRRDAGLPLRRGDRRALDDTAARYDMSSRDRVRITTVVGTSPEQVAIAPGTLTRAWTEHGRAWFAYDTEVPVRNNHAVFSARYAVHDTSWNGIPVRVFHHPTHAWNAGRIARAAVATLADMSARYGPYPYRQLTLVEYPSPAGSASALPATIMYGEGLAVMNPAADTRNLDFLSAIIAHEVAHQWWGNHLTPANAEGAPLLTESLAWYSAMAVVERTQGSDGLRSLLDLMREAYLGARPLAALPLLRTDDDFLAYRKGPFALHALAEHVGRDTVDAALRRFIAAHGGGKPPLPTARDLYAELERATPDSLRPLLHDLFEANVYWALECKNATAERLADGQWRVTMDLVARKFAVDTLGNEADLPILDGIEIGVYGADDAGGKPGAPLYLERHRLRAGRNSIVVTVPAEPNRAGVDPRRLLIDVRPGNNVATVRRAAPP
jgi:ABC-type transport system involved in multi-copper enzyme maturation permease subunit